jgi:hypothetical protein
MVLIMKINRKSMTEKKITPVLIMIIILLIILVVVTRTFKKAEKSKIISPSHAFFSKGNAPDSIRISVIHQLHSFQDGYSKRDTNQLRPFMEALYSRNRIFILGTNPGEIFNGYKRATNLVRNDWESWGDCKFNIDSANISSSGNTAWFSTRGLVKFDLSSLLVIPLRLTGVMVKEEGTWKFQQQQFQLDIDFSFTLIAIILLSSWFFISIISFAILIIRWLKR